MPIWVLAGRNRELSAVPKKAYAKLDSKGLNVWLALAVDSFFQRPTLTQHALCLQEGDPAGYWEETFKSHTDSKPKGPEAISLDLSFAAAQHVYGLPEHATALSLNPTIGASGM